jgi:hypothetical protein
MTLLGTLHFMRRVQLLFVRCACAREDYHLLEGIHGSKRMEAKLDQVFCEPQTWESLSVVKDVGIKRKWV